jgi:hypothetical protein
MSDAVPSGQKSRCIVIAFSRTEKMKQKRADALSSPLAEKNEA